MATAVVTPRPLTLGDYAFLPTGKREQVKFLPHDEKWHLQIFDANSIQDWDLSALKLKGRQVTPQELAPYQDPTEAIEDKRAWIEQHLDRRVQLFFQQAILCYKTPFFYDGEGAEDQIGVGHTLSIHPRKPHKTQAAHSSTLPCLYAYPVGADGKVIESQKFVFMKHGHGYKQHNATVELPISVNQTDTLVDGKTGKDNKLRSRAIKLLNRAAKGTLPPTKATILFLKNFRNVLAKSLQNLAGNDLRAYVIREIYLPHIQGVLADVQDNSDIFDQIMGVNVTSATNDEVCLRKIVYRQRYRVIQQAEFIESRIAVRILQAQNKMFKTRKKSLKSVDYRLRYALLRGASDLQRRRLERLFCTSLDQLNAGMAYKRDKLRKFERGIDKFTEKHNTEIANLRRDLRVFFKELEASESQFRSSLFKDLRIGLRNWYQKEFVVAFRALFPNEPMSQAMVSRLEHPSRAPQTMSYKTPLNQRRKEMTVLKAQKIAATYGIDVGLFLPGLVSSNY